jgi:hypothetical protein
MAGGRFILFRGEISSYTFPGIESSGLSGAIVCGLSELAKKRVTPSILSDRIPEQRRRITGAEKTGNPALLVLAFI